MPSNPSFALRVVVGGSAVAAPVLHSLTDVMEWYQNGFSPAQLWLNYIAFLPMPWLLLGVYATRREALGTDALIGAVLHGVAFTYFAHTTLYALAAGVPDYEALWSQLGSLYTIHGAFMIIGGLLFVRSALHGKCLPPGAVVLFGIGLIVNLVLALVPAPDILQTVGTAIRNAGLVGIGYAVVRGERNGAL
jgi:hypothetical protein